jgi:outer membrane protein TolC
MKMRVMLCIALLLQMFIADGQDKIRQSYTLDQALSIALENNPLLSTEKDRKKLKCDVKSAWYKWLYRIIKQETLQEFYITMSDLERIATLRFKSGDLDFFETSTIMRKYADIQTAAALSVNEIDMSDNTIRQLLYIDEEIIPADTNLILYEIDKSAAYIQQDDLSMLSGHDSIFFRYKAFVDERIIENKQLELDNLFIRLQFYDHFGLNHAETIIQTAEARYKSEEIDYIELTEILSEAYSIRLDYLEILNDYNQHAIQMEYNSY